MEFSAQRQAKRNDNPLQNSGKAVLLLMEAPATVTKQETEAYLIPNLFQIQPIGTLP